MYGVMSPADMLLPVCGKQCVCHGHIASGKMCPPWKYFFENHDFLFLFLFAFGDFLVSGVR